MRFASLIRVSTEKQKQRGESLNIQRASNERNVAYLGGHIVAAYGGQEHATPGWEKAEVNRLISDSGKGLFDAVIVAYADRWSRDNVESDQGLDTFKRNGVRFYVGATEYQLANAQHRLFLRMAAAIGQFQAEEQLRKSLDSKIKRANDGLPVCGKLPFGRTFDRQAGKWGVDPAKQALIQAIAKRYLAGESLPALALEHGLSVSNLTKTLFKLCGPEWVQEFDCEDLNIHARVITVVPPLLDAATIQAVRERADGNKHWFRRRRVNRHTLAGFVRCGACGYSMYGKVHTNGLPYYTHLHNDRLVKSGMSTCTYASMRIRGDTLDGCVLTELFDLFGNPAAVERAVRAATPDAGEVDELRARHQRLTAEIAKVDQGRGRVVDAIADGALTKDQAKGKLAQLAEREGQLRAELAAVDVKLQGTPTPEEVKAAGAWVAGQFRRYTDAYQVAQTRLANHDVTRMTYDDQRALMETVFGGTLPDGRRMGVYVHWQEKRKRCTPWEYRLLGRLVDPFLRAPDAQVAAGTACQARGAGATWSI